MDSFSAHQGVDADLRIVPQRTALLVVDMLNDFCEPGGAMVLPDAQVLYEPQNALIRAARESGSVIIFVNDAHRGSMRRDREFLKREPHCIDGSPGAEVVAALNREATDICITKRRYSGFFGTDLDLTLKDMEVDTVIVVGVVTNICVRSTVHDAFFMGYRVVVPQDAVAATGPREQASSLYDIATHFGWVSDSAQIIAALTQGQPVSNVDIPE